MKTARRRSTDQLTISSVASIHYSSSSSCGDCEKVPAAQTKDEVERGLLLDVVVAQGAVLKLLAGEDEALLVGRDALLVLDLLLHVLHATTEVEGEVDSGLLLDAVVGEGAAVLELLARKKRHC